MYLQGTVRILSLSAARDGVPADEEEGTKGVISVKKILSILLVLTMLISAAAFAESGPGGTPPGDPPGGMGTPPDKPDGGMPGGPRP